MPLTEARFGVPAVSVFRPVYTLVLAAALIFALIKGTRTGAARYLVLTALAPHEGKPVAGQELRLYDMRFGFPGSALTGLWGMTAIVDAEGHLVAARRYSVDREIDDGDLIVLARAELGLPQQLF